MRKKQLLMMAVLFGVSLLIPKYSYLIHSMNFHNDHPHIESHHHKHNKNSHRGVINVFIIEHTHTHQHDTDSPEHSHSHSHEIFNFAGITFIYEDTKSQVLAPEQSVKKFQLIDNVFVPNTFLCSIFRPPISTIPSV